MQGFPTGTPLFALVVGLALPTWRLAEFLRRRRIVLSSVFPTEGVSILLARVVRRLIPTLAAVLPATFPRLLVIPVVLATIPQTAAGPAELCRNVRRFLG